VPLLLATLLCSLLFAAPAFADSESKESGKERAARLQHDFQNEIVLIKGKNGSGTGFIGDVSGKKFLFSNAHVLAGIKAPTFTLMNRKPVKLGPASVAVGHDLVMIVVVEGGSGIPVAKPLETYAGINDDILVLGNPGRGEVVTSLEGKLVGIGPNRVEVTAAFERGNSGSPIIHLNTGKVLGVASDARADELLNGRIKLRRYGYRLDSVEKWQAIDWKRFYLEADIFEKVEHTTMELVQAVNEVTSPGRLNRARRYAYESPVVRGAVDSFYQTLSNDSGDGRTAVRTLLSALQSASKGDIPAANTSLTYDYFRRRLGEETKIRTELMKEFSAAVEK
jgi:hypothetical protein